MKNVLIAVLAMLVSATVVADQKQPQTEQKGDQAQKFQESKQRMLERIDHRIAALQTVRNCAAQAQDKESFKACRPEHEHEAHHDGDHDCDHHDRDSGMIKRR